jgi:O-acetyl-ADP-ribose deacetylase (regulator of RNase III)
VSTAVVGDVTEAQDAKYVCDAADGVGVVEAGVAGAHGPSLATEASGRAEVAGAHGRAEVAEVPEPTPGPSVQEGAVRVYKESDPQPGSPYVTSADRSPYVGVAQSVTTEYDGAGPGYYVARSCLESSVSSCSEDSVTSVASTASGTGVGRSSEDAVTYASVEEPYPAPHAVSEVADLDEDSVEYADYCRSGAKESSSDGSGP